MMNDDMMRLAIITGSVRDERFGPTVTDWFARVAARRPEFEVDVIDLASFDIPDDMSATDDQRDFARRIEAADAIVVVTPEYNHSFPGPLKTAIDSLKTQWQGKPVGFVSYGGISGGLRAVEALRIVYAELHAVTVRDVVAFPMAWTKFDDNGDPVETEVVGIAADALLNNLTWWAAALKKARADAPYGQPLAMAR
jgi:NAD(P)H-dependent FMN reductase